MAKMGVNRKLQTEIDRTLKKVDEGVALFDEIWDKVYSATQQNQKEKYEGDLKKEIKKLQRHRDSIKGWLQSNDIKDKTILLEVRRRIESKMEQFKVCEKETKTKKFSKEGLAREAEMDPEEKERMEKREWLSDKIQMLNTQMEGFEADLEKVLGALGKKKKPAESERIAVLENALKQHNYHIGRLEQMLRLLDNSDLAPDQVDSIMEDLDWYINQAGDDIHMIETFGSDDAYDLYEALELDALAAPGAPPVVKGAKKLDVFAEGDEDEEEDDSTGGDTDEKLSGAAGKLRGKKVVAVAAAAGGIPLTIGRPVVKAAKESKVAIPTPVARVRVPATAGGMPIIGRPVVSPAAPPLKVAKVPGLGDSPQAATVLQGGAGGGQRELPGQPGQPGGAGIGVQGGRLGGLGSTQPMSQAGGIGTPSKLTRANTAGTPDNLHTPQRPQQGMVMNRTPPSGGHHPNNNVNNNANNINTPSTASQPAVSHASPSAFPGATGQPPHQNNQLQSSLTPQGQQAQANAQAQAGTHVQQGQQQKTQQQQVQAHQQHQHQQAQLQQQQQQQQQQEQQQAQQQQLQLQQQQQQQHQAQLQQQAAQQQGQQQQRPGSATGKGGPLDPSAGMGLASEDDAPGVGMGLGLGQHHPGLGMQRQQNDQSSARAALQQSMIFAPQTHDSERTKPYAPRNPYRTPAAFPSQPAIAFENPRMFEKLHTDTLFLIFYYQQGTYQQYLAARELKRQSWRYHKKYMTWFQRHEEPKVTTDEYEQGTYVYFDYETGWCQRIKSDFRFDYSFLEDETL